MFGRTNQDQKIPSQPVHPANLTPVPPAAPPVAVAQPPAAPVTESVIGDDLAILGDKITIVTQSRVRVNGMIQGDISGQEVVIGPQGQVQGTVIANDIKVEGNVSGALRAASVTLMPTARVEGDICHQKLAISEGAQFDGSVRRAKDSTEITPNLDVNSLAGQGA